MTGTEYLTRNLLPLIESIEPKPTKSFSMKALGLGHVVSSQGILIALGTRYEKFWNQVLTESTAVQNQLPFDNGTDKIKVNSKNRQVDHFFSINDLENNKNIYLESKCNLDFDTEKKPESNAKIIAVNEELVCAFGNTQCGYYVPVLRDIPEEVQSKYRSAGVPVYGVSDMYRWLDGKVPFTMDEYFDFILTVLGPIVADKLGVTVNKPSTERIGGDMDAL